jgi:hypothetical protein
MCLSRLLEHLLEHRLAEEPDDEVLHAVGDHGDPIGYVIGWSREDLGVLRNTA